MSDASTTNALYRTIWRWHFYAGLFIIPMILILSVTGAMYLFKPQVERWEERPFQGLPTMGAVSPSAQRDAALAAFPDAKFLYYRLPERTGDAALIHVGLSGGETTRDVFVSPQGKVLGALDPDKRIMEIAHDIHGQLLVGRGGSWLVELAASWAIVLILTGFYLWLPRGDGLAGVLWPRLGRGQRILLRDLHAVTGFWVAGFATVLLITGLPWADVWGSGFNAIRTEMGWIKGEPDWTIGGRAINDQEHVMHMSGGTTMMMHNPAATADAGGVPGANLRQPSGVTLDQMVVRAISEHLAFPVIIAPPSQPALPWTIRSDSQNRPLRVTLKYDPWNGHELSRETFADKHVIDRVVGYGVAWHEGQLFGVTNQIVGTLTALGLITVAITGFLGWRRRKPKDKLGALPQLPFPPKARGAQFIMALCLIFLPMFTVSVLVLWLFDKLVLPRLPGIAGWLGMGDRVQC